MDADHHVTRRRVGSRLLAHRIASVCATGVLTLLVALMAVLLVGSLLGYRALTTRSGSMTPTIRVGDVVVATSVSPLSVRPGQIVTFRDPALDQQLVTHRVVSIHRVGRAVDFVTKGDANLVTEHWSVPVSGHLGRKAFVIPRLGRAVAALSSKSVRVAALALSALLVAAIGLRRIWRQPDVSVAPQH
ncbi:MAG: signal peptidase I [Acidobacteriota bacterium]|nr:signal peptidase I [Acidobacteriota bacterium]